MQIKMNIPKPTMPNFIVIKDFGEKEITIPVQNLSKEEACQYAELMRATFIEHWENKVKNK